MAKLKRTRQVAALAEKLEAWTVGAGGKERWAEWIISQSGRCHRRARKWHRQRGTEGLLQPRKLWAESILSAVNSSGGFARLSALPLTLSSPRLNTDALWPSIDHTEHPGVALVVIETRVVNDMKTIFSDAEFRQMIGHLAVTLGIEPHRLPAGWTCQRNFAGAQKDEEPPLPAA